jgi:hypothetical protein
MKKTSRRYSRGLPNRGQDAGGAHEMRQQRLSRSSERCRAQVHSEVIASSNKCEIRLICTRATELRVQLQVRLRVRITHADRFPAPEDPQFPKYNYAS